MIHEATITNLADTDENIPVTNSVTTAEPETAATTSGVTVKGWRNGLLLILPFDGTWDSVLQQVHAKLDEAKARSFWRGAQTTIDCGMRVVPRAELSALVDFVKRAFGLVPVAVVATDEATRVAGQLLGLAPYAELPLIKKPARERDVEAEREAEKEAPEKETPGERSAFYPNNALYVPNTIRSGQRLVHDGHLIICGDVNAGAEVMAGGDIVVMGTLRGLAHAGCYGDESARIVAGNLRPPQLRIASKIARSPEEGARPQSGPRIPEVARIEGEEIGVFPL
jgi:septum site-determining protein MinC